MVGPLSSEEIEDVVSSVRRLVSNEQGARRASRDLGAERLLLTPALRVVSEASPLAPLILDAPAVEAEPAQPAEAKLSDPAVELVEAGWEDDLWTGTESGSLGEVALGADEAEILAADAEEAAFAVDVPDTDATEWAQTDWSDEGPVPFIPLRRRAEHLASRLAAGEIRDPDEPDEDLDDDAPKTEAAVPTDAAPQAYAPDVAPELLEDDLLTTEAGSDVSSASGAEPDDASAQRMPTEILDADGTPLAVLDEAALQEIVRQMIREELQGSLGERITRNVRKLVRAEINRALIARDLD